jgi:hypothetical protein
MAGRSFAAHESPKTRRKKSAAMSCPEWRISSRGTAAIYATFIKTKRAVTRDSEMNPAFLIVRTGSAPLTSPITLKALCHPLKAKLVFTKAVASELKLEVLPSKIFWKLAYGSSILVVPARTAAPTATML